MCPPERHGLYSITQATVRSSIYPSARFRPVTFAHLRSASASNRVPSRIRANEPHCQPKGCPAFEFSTVFRFVALIAPFVCQAQSHPLKQRCNLCYYGKRACYSVHDVLNLSYVAQSVGKSCSGLSKG
jgi:hypothetical protein